MGPAAPPHRPRPATPRYSRSASRWVRVGVLAVAIALVLGADPAAAQQQGMWVTQTAAAMTPAQRVGQLFVVTFDGADAGATSQIAGLIREAHVGGVLLDPGRGNFTNGPEAPEAVATLANALQSVAAEEEAPAPLLVALRQKGDTLPDNRLVGGMTPLPSLMALGATWDTTQAERIGDIVGRELASIGVNLLLGPDADVAASPQGTVPGDRGSRSFGGSAQWVGRMASRYIEGVHTGSGGRVATALGQFPGIGAVDRSPDAEAAVVDKPFSALVDSELVPFIAASRTTRPGGVTDALATTHARYRGIQQQPDRPLSLDSGGLAYLWAQVPDLGAWRTAGGVVISPALGAPAVRRYDDPTLREFNHRRIIREALGAGHDLLLTEGFGSSPATEMETVTDAARWLTEMYQEDEAVRGQVDAALARVLALKRRLYPNAGIVPAQVESDAAAGATGTGTEAVRSVARAALTRIGPASAPAGEPELGDRILFVVDSRPQSPCRQCDDVLIPDPEFIAGAVRRGYGRAGTHRVEDEDVNAVSFEELAATFADAGVVEGAAVSADRRTAVAGLAAEADLVVFVLRDQRRQGAVGDAMQRYLSSAPAGGQRFAALALGAPYYVDTSEMARLDRYYAAYAASEPFVETALRALFGDEAAVGASPVSIPGAGYDLARALEPARPDIALEAVGRSAEAPVALGTNLTVRTLAIFDANGHEVPDGTPVTFRRFDKDEGLFLPDVEAVTENGRATASVRAERSGELEITAAFANGVRSLPLIVRVEGDGTAPVPAPELAYPSPAVTMPARPPVDWGILVLSLTAMLLPGAVLYGSEASLARAPRRALRVVLISVCWGLAGYLLVAAGGVSLSSVGGTALWPASWSPAYQAPLFSFVLAGLAVLPAVLSGGPPK